MLRVVPTAWFHEGVLLKFGEKTDGTCSEDKRTNDLAIVLLRAPMRFL